MLKFKTTVQVTTLMILMLGYVDRHLEAQDLTR